MQIKDAEKEIRNYILYNYDNRWNKLLTKIYIAYM